MINPSDLKELGQDEMGFPILSDSFERSFTVPTEPTVPTVPTPFQIFSYLRPRERVRVGCTCARWREVAQDAELWRDLALGWPWSPGKRQMSNEFLENYLVNLFQAGS